MSLESFLSAYFNLNILLFIGFASLFLISQFLQITKWQWQSVLELKLHYTLVGIVLCMASLQPFLPSNDIFFPVAKVWASSSIKNFSQMNHSGHEMGDLAVPTPLGTKVIAAEKFSKAWIFLAGFFICISGFLLVCDLRWLYKLKQRSFLVRRLGKVRIFINEETAVPFTYWLPGQANVFVPSILVYHREDFRMVIAHEIQHHRQGDTRWVYIMWGLKLICVINPAIYFWNRWISEIQEFACDETLVDHGRVDSQAYARCLVKVAQTAIDQKHVPVCATGLTFLIERNFLKRRVKKMFSKSAKKIKAKISIAVGIVITVIMSATAYASKGLVQDRRVSFAQAKAMASRAQSDSGFPIVLNEHVLKQLNRYIGTPEGREFMKESLQRMENYKGVVSENIRKYGMPEEMMAVPLIESGYQNLPESKNSGWPAWKAAGIWQFIRGTAKNFGLVVTEKQDDRMNVALLTDAAMRYLQANHLRFKDWQLATLAYNMGENSVQKGIDVTGSRDAWTLIRNGHEGDKDYLAKVMAAILIMKNPESVN